MPMVSVLEDLRKVSSGSCLKDVGCDILLRKFLLKLVQICWGQVMPMASVLEGFRQVSSGSCLKVVGCNILIWKLCLNSCRFVGDKLCQWRRCLKIFARFHRGHT
jgi:hypothetical protein